MKTFKFILKRINCLVCDLALSYIFFYLLLFIRPIGFPLIAYYYCSVVLYFGITYVLFHRSLMQKISGIVITKHRIGYILLKIILVGIIPFCLSYFCYELFLYLSLIVYLAVRLLFTLFLLPFTKKSLWQWVSGAQVEAQKDFNKSKKWIVIPLLITSVLIGFQWIRQGGTLDKISNNNKNIALPISQPEKAYFVKNINQYKQEPVNYVMQLFDKHDMVILCERHHADCTQWEFFSKIILNDAFAEKVKNVFTEVGNAKNQEILDAYMNTRFSTEEDLQRATAQIVRENGGSWAIWNNKNMYDFILNLHQFNEEKDSVNRINLFFSDITNWDEIKNSAQWDSLTHVNRDSIMASNILNRYEAQHLDKSLVITNTRHAWNYRDSERNEASYIGDKLRDKMAVVWINGTTQIIMPSMNGTLDEVALAITDSIWAIDFQKCPLGNMTFDLMFNKQKKCTYKDLFVGMVYCKHPSNWEIVHNYPFILDNYKEILLKKSAIIGEDYLNSMNNSIESGYFDKIKKSESEYPSIYNVDFLFLHCIILLFLFLNLLVLLLKKPKKSAQ